MEKKIKEDNRGDEEGVKVGEGGKGDGGREEFWVLSPIKIVIMSR